MPTRKKNLTAVPAPADDDLELELDLDDLDLEEELAPAPEPVKAPAKRTTKAKTATKPAPKADEVPVVGDFDVATEYGESKSMPLVEVAFAEIVPPKPARKSTHQAVEDAGGNPHFLVGYALGKFGVELDSERAQDLRETLAVAEVGYDHPLFARLLGVGSSASTAKPAKTRATKPARTSGSASTAPKASKGDVDLQAVRAWAQANGYDVKDRGRIKGEIVAAYQEANG